jgi:positive regulator of sigma E activity
MNTAPTASAALVSPTRYRGAARLAWLLPVGGMVLNSILRRSAGALVADAVVMLLVLAGIVAGVYALTGVSRVGAKGVVGPAVAGLIVNGLLVLIFVSNLTASH